jgi:hypothetical protein
MRLLASLLLSVAAPVFIAAQTPAPGLANSILVLTYPEPAYIATRTVLLRPDGSYQEISFLAQLQRGDGSLSAPTSFPPSHGSYVYTSSPDSPSAGELALTDASSVAPLEVALDFSTGRSTFGTAAGSIVGTFQVFPSVATTGASNVSNRTWVSAARPSFTGFVIEGGVARWVLVRGAGASLSLFGLPGPLATCQMLVTTGNTTLGPVPSWSTDPNLAPGLATVFALVGAFPFPGGSTDSAALLFLKPGAYVIQSNATQSDGEFLTEVYVLPYGA